MSFLFWGKFIAIATCQASLSIVMWEYPQPIVFSNQNDFENGVKTNLTLLVYANRWRGRRSKWELTVHTEDDKLQNGNHEIPVSAIWAKAENNSRVKNTGKKYLSTQYQTIAKKKNNSRSNSSALVDVQLNAYDGSQFMKPTGDYTTYMYFTLVLD